MTTSERIDQLERTIKVMHEALIEISLKLECLEGAVQGENNRFDQDY